MAWVSGNTFETSCGSKVNVSAKIGIQLTSTPSCASGKITFKFKIYMYQDTSTWSYNRWSVWYNNTQYTLFNSNSGSDHTTKNTKYYSPEFTYNADYSGGSISISVKYKGNAWSYSNDSGAGTASITMAESGLPAPAPAVTAPTLSNISVSSITDGGASLSFSISNNGGENPSTKYIDVFTDSGCTNKVKTITGNSGSVSGLDANRTYYARGNATNSGGTTYTSVKSFKTTWTDPGNPGKPSLTYDTPELTKDAKLTYSWSAASAGSTAISGYRIRIYKNGAQQAMVDTESTSTSYQFNASTYSFTDGDTVMFSVFAYCKDYNGDKHFSGNASVPVFSDSSTFVAQRYCWVSENGGNFVKRRVYLSQQGNDFFEVKKGW